MKLRDERGVLPPIDESALLRASRSPELWEYLVPLPVGTPPARYIARFTGHPTGGKGAQLAALMTERAHARAADGERIALQVERSGTHSGALTFATLHESMADMEASWNRVQGSSASTEYIATVDSLMAAAPTREIFEVVIPFPPAE